MWVLVKLTNAKSAKFYVAKVEKVTRQKQDVDAVFLKPYSSTTDTELRLFA